MNHEEEKNVRRKLIEELKREGWRRIKPLTWQLNGHTVDLDAAVMIDGRLRSQWGVMAEERRIKA
jgi:hypothetical protein